MGPLTVRLSALTKGTPSAQAPQAACRALLLPSTPRFSLKAPVRPATAAPGPVPLAISSPQWPLLLEAHTPALLAPTLLLGLYIRALDLLPAFVHGSAQQGTTSRVACAWSVQLERFRQTLVSLSVGEEAYTVI